MCPPPDFETARPSMHLTAAEALALMMPSPLIRMNELVAAAPRGDGHSVLVLPGLGHTDANTATVRTFLTETGYDANGWELGTNFGPTDHLVAAATERLIALSDRRGPVSIVGFSLGGLFARLLAARMPDRVRRIVTVCSPIHEPARSFWLPLEPLFGMLWGSDDLDRMSGEVRHEMPVPCTALYSRDDGVVNWSACVDRSASAESIEIGGPHMLIATNPDVLTILGQTLARPAP